MASLVFSDFMAQLMHPYIQVGDLPVALLTLQKVEEKETNSSTEARGGVRGSRDSTCPILSPLGFHSGTQLSLQGFVGTQDKSPHFPA